MEQHRALFGNAAAAGDGTGGPAFNVKPPPPGLTNDQLVSRPRRTQLAVVMQCAVNDFVCLWWQAAYYEEQEKALIEQIMLSSEREYSEIKETKRTQVKSLAIEGAIMGSGEFKTVRNRCVDCCADCCVDCCCFDCCADCCVDCCAD